MIFKTQPPTTTAASLRILVAWLCLGCAVVIGQPVSNPPAPAPTADRATPVDTGLPLDVPTRSLTDVSPKDPDAAGSGKITQEELRAKLQAIQNSSDLAADVRTDLIRYYNSALSYLKSAEIDKAKAATFQEILVSSPQETANIRKDLAEPPQEQAALAPELLTSDQTTIEQLEQTSRKYKSVLSTAEADLASYEQQLQDEKNKPEELQDRQISKRVRLTEIEEELGNLARTVGAPTLIGEAKRYELLAERDATQASVRALTQESLSHEARMALITAKRDWSKHNVARLQEDLEKIQEVVNQRRRAEASRERSEAVKALDTGGKHELVQQLAKVNAKYSDDLFTVVADIERRQKISRDVDQQSKQIADESKNADPMLKAANLSEDLGLILRKRRAKLAATMAVGKAVVERDKTIAKVGLARVLVDNELEQLNDIDARIDALLTEHQVLPAVGEQIRPQMRKLLQDRQGLLIKLQDRYQTYISELKNQADKEKQLVTSAQDFAKKLDEGLLWIRSAQPISRATFTAAGGALAWLGSWDGLWRQTLDAVCALARSEPLLWSAAGLAYLAIVFWGVRLRRYLRTINHRVEHVDADSFATTVEATIITIILAVPLPAALAFIAWQLKSSNVTPDNVQAVAAGLGAAALTLLLLRAFYIACHEHGLFPAHFGWSRHTVALLRRAALIMLFAAVPARFILSTLNAHAMISQDGGEAFVNSLGRLAFIAVMFTSGLVLLRVLKPSTGITANLVRRHPDGWLSRLRFIWYPLGVGTWFGFGIMAAAGYFYTAQQLGSGRLQATFWLVVGALLVRELLVRWLLVSQRRALVARELERRRLDRTRPTARPIPDASATEPAQIDTRMYQLLRAVVACTIFVGLWLIWSSVLPALSTLNTITIPGTTELSVQDLLTAIAIIVITLVLGRDIPSILEIAILQRLPFNAGERYAIGTITRYLITILGVVYALIEINVQWDHVQWLVAAMAVGLGFGLQEIFVNFISGLIILFEQPIRLGDRVTVSGIVGTVSRIRIRATILTDRDRRELIIPNKEFITGQVINWTLSNSMTRVIIPVGIAHGSDRQKARQLLLEAARTCPLVMDDPEPEVFFVGFGDSALNFQVRAFVKNIWQRTPARDAMHENIDNLFRAAGIVIPFPQQDLHVQTHDAAGKRATHEPDDSHRFAPAR